MKSLLCSFVFSRVLWGRSVPSVTATNKEKSDFYPSLQIQGAALIRLLTDYATIDPTAFDPAEPLDTKGHLVSAVSEVDDVPRGPGMSKMG